ncbi:hypothetical protein AWI07_24660 [Enterobacter roggenkampii]|nr:hypothetical protein AWI07_24660 [Enterobacter roggenkampii]
MFYPPTSRQVLGGQPAGKLVTTWFVREGFSLLKELHGDVPLTYVYTDLRDIVLRGNTGLDAHQAGQKATMKDFVEGYDPKTGPSNLVP